MNDRALTTIRLPADCKAFIEAEARENASSQNSEIVRLIRLAMRAKQAGAASAPPLNKVRTNTEREGARV